MVAAAPEARRRRRHGLIAHGARHLLAQEHVDVPPAPARPAPRKPRPDGRQHPDSYPPRAPPRPTSTSLDIPDTVPHPHLWSQRASGSPRSPGGAPTPAPRAPESRTRSLSRSDEGATPRGGGGGSRHPRRTRRAAPPCRLRRGKRSAPRRGRRPASTLSISPRRGTRHARLRAEAPVGHPAGHTEQKAGPRWGRATPTESPTVEHRRLAAAHHLERGVHVELLVRVHEEQPLIVIPAAEPHPRPEVAVGDLHKGGALELQAVGGPELLGTTVPNKLTLFQTSSQNATTHANGSDPRARRASAVHNRGTGMSSSSRKKGTHPGVGRQLLMWRCMKFSWRRARLKPLTVPWSSPSVLTNKSRAGANLPWGLGFANANKKEHPPRTVSGNVSRASGAPTEPHARCATGARTRCRSEPQGEPLWPRSPTGRCPRSRPSPRPAGRAPRTRPTR